MQGQSLWELNNNINFVQFTVFQTKQVDNKYVFKCQHGEEECYANKVHACSVDIIENMTASVKFTDCMIADNMDSDKALTRVTIIFIQY